MRVVHLGAFVLAAGLASACGGGARNVESADTAQRRAIARALTGEDSPPAVTASEVGTGRSLTPVEPYDEQYDRSGWSGMSDPPGRGGGPRDLAGAASALEELRRAPDAPRYTAPSPTGASPAEIEHEGTVNPSPALPAPRPDMPPPRIRR